VRRTQQWTRIEAGLISRNGEHFRDEQWWSHIRWSSHAVIGSAHPRLSTTAIKWYEPPECTKVREARRWWPFRKGSSGRVFSWVTPHRRHSSIGIYLLFLFHQLTICQIRWRMTVINLPFLIDDLPNIYFDFPSEFLYLYYIQNYW